MSEVFMSDGTLLKVSSMASPEVLTTIPGVMNITPPSRVRKSTDVYIMDQSAPVVKTGAYQPQEVSFELAYDKGEATHIALQTSQANKTAINYKIVFPMSPTLTISFTAQVASFEWAAMNAEGTDPIRANVTLKLSADYTTA
jgi:hypothetical protein